MPSNPGGRRLLAASISFRDFPMPDRYPDYPHHSHIFEWLRHYADAFNLREAIRSTRACSTPSGAPGEGGE
jgi:cation diffusion facilitator CzcD-associated flavoprotein CzcO